MVTKVLITAGTRMSHLPYLAGSLDTTHVDYTFLMGLYPMRRYRLILRLLSSQTRKKISSRNQGIPEPRVKTSLESEILAHVLQISRKLKCSQSIINFLTSAVHRTFALRACLLIQQLQPQIYHYRSSFGLLSVNAAKKVGAKLLCDHSIAHPFLIDYLTENRGRLPTKDKLKLIMPNEICYHEMREDLKSADHIVVNSEFVKETLTHMNIPEEQISVVELSIEQKFLESVSRLQSQVSQHPINEILFAGSWVERKGVWDLANAIRLLDGKVRLRVAGSSTASIDEYCSLHNISSANIIGLGYLDREELAREMLATKIFVFPSYCEGMAKTIQEAMACGCFIIATPNSGFNVSYGARGMMVEAGDPEGLARTILRAVTMNEQDRGSNENTAIAFQRFSPQNYAKNMTSVYHKMLSQGKVDQSNLVKTT